MTVKYTYPQWSPPIYVKSILILNRRQPSIDISNNSIPALENVRILEKRGKHLASSRNEQKYTRQHQARDRVSQKCCYDRVVEQFDHLFAINNHFGRQSRAELKRRTSRNLRDVRNFLNPPSPHTTELVFVWNQSCSFHVLDEYQSTTLYANPQHIRAIQQQLPNRSEDSGSGA